MNNTIKDTFIEMNLIAMMDQGFDCIDAAEEYEVTAKEVRLMAIEQAALNLGDGS